MNDRMIGAIAVLERMAHSIENSIADIRNGKMSAKSEECLKQATLKSIELARLLSDARGWEITAANEAGIPRPASRLDRDGLHELKVKPPVPEKPENQGRALAEMKVEQVIVPIKHAWNEKNLQCACGLHLPSKVLHSFHLIEAARSES